MGFSVFDPVTQDQATQTAVDRANQQKRAKETLTPDIADRVREIYKKAPYIPASVILSMAKAGTSDTTIDAVKTQSARVTAASLDPNRKPKQSWFERNVMSHVKSATRWGFAGLQLLPDLAQNAASQVFSPNDPAGSEGWFRSTNLGTMFANSGQAGSGFFMGEEAAKSQAEKAREFRGTVNGHAWTVGRGAAQLAFTPGSVAYNVLSGFIDGAVQIGADPTTYLGPKVKKLRAARAAIPSLIGEDAMRAASALAKGEAGLESAESLAFTQSKFGQWVSTDRRARRLTNAIKDIAANQVDSLETKTQKILENFNYSISPEIAAEFAKADDVGKVQGILGAASGKLASNPDEVLLPKDVRDLRLSKVKAGLFDDAAERFPVLNGVRNNRYFSAMPKGSVIINGTGLDRAKAIKNYSNYLKGIGIGVNSAEYRNVMDNVVRAYTMAEPGVQRPAVQEAFDAAFEAIAKHAGVKGKSQEDAIRAIITQTKNELSKARAYNISEIGMNDDGGMMQLLRQYAPEGALDHIDPTTWDKLTIQGPGLLSEIADDIVVLPDFRKMRRLSGMLRLATSTPGGEQRGAIAVTEWAQNEIWKPLTLATGGYMMRNMIDAQTRIAMNGLSGGFRHPMDYMMWVMHRKGFEDIKGGDFEKVGFFKKLSQDLPNLQKEYADAVSFDNYRHLEDPQLAYERQLRNGNWSLVDRGTNPQAHTIGYIDNLALIHSAPESARISQLAAMNVDPETRLQMVKDWLNSDAGKDAKDTLTQYIRNGIRYTDPDTGMQGVIKLGDQIPDELINGWIDRMTNFRVNTITRGDRDLNIVAGYNRVPLQIRDGAGHLRTAPRETVKIDDLSPSDFLSGDGDLGSIINLGEDRHGLVVGRRAATAGEIDPFTGEMLQAGDVLTVQPIHTTDAFQGFLGSPELRNMIDAKGLRGELAQKVKRAERGLGGEKNLQSRAMEAKNKFVDVFFGQLYGGLTRNLEKSPVFRQLYYKEIGGLVDELAPAEAQKLLDRVMEASRTTGIKAERYVGDKATLDKLRRVAAMDTPTTYAINKQALETAQNVFWHGTPVELEGNKFSDVFESMSNDAENLMGRGIYITDSGQVAASYTSKGAKKANVATATVDGINVAPGGRIYKIRVLPSAKILDVTKPSGDVASIVKNLVSQEWVSNIIDEANNSVEDVLRIANDPNAPAEQIISTLKENLRGARKYDADEVFFDFSTEMSKITDAIKYQGGVRRGGLGKHTALTVLNRDILQIDDVIAPVMTRATGVTGTLDTLDEYAKAVALRNTKEMLYNASERSNIEDILRIVVPFGPAWREVLGNYMQALVEDPTRVRRAQLIFDGARKFDPDGNGQGFFYKDPTTGQYMFNFPLSGEVNQLVTGLNAPLQAPVKQMSIGLQVIPSIGPVAQIAASKLIPDTPDTDFITNILLPYGKKSGLDLMPRWASRLGEAITGNTMNTATVFGNTYIETVRALSASGEYDLADPAEQERLYADAKTKAQILTGIRSLAQFIGPTSPTTEFIVSSKEGDIYSSQLVKEFQKLQTENYDTAVQRFLEIYGNDALLYVSNKTQSVKGGLEASKEFGTWERENQALFNAYPDVAGFMAPGGDNFSFAVWSRQLATGKRRRLTDREMVELAQYRVASAKYRELRDKLPTNPTDDQRRWLRNWRIQLNKEYPGFPAVAEFNPGQFPAQIEQMKRMVADPRLQGNDVADALKTYLDARDQAIERATQAGYANLSSIAATPLRDWLSNVGKALKVDTPEFARIYDRLLANEIED